MARKDEFIANYMPLATNVAQRLNVPVEGVLNHWGLETGWGKSVIPGTNNLGNIKDFSGKGVGATDNMTGSRDNYKVYSSPEEFANGYVNLIGGNPRYAKALNTETAYDFANGLQQGGYAEDPNFARKVAGMPVLQQSMSAINGGSAPVEFLAGREGNLKVQDPSQISPEAVQATENINRMQDFKRQMLPLAMGAMMSGDAGSRTYGQNAFREAMEGVEPFKMQNGFLTDEGQYITDQDQSGLLKMTLDQMRKDMTAQRDQGNKNLSFELQLADNYTQNTKKAVDSIDAFKKFETGFTNGMNDMAMVFNFMRILDPESTVKTTEFEQVAKAAGVPDRIAQLLPKAMAGEILTPEQRNQIKDIGLKFAGDAANTLQGRYDYVKGIGERNGLNVDNVIPAMHGEWIKDIRTKQTAAAERQANAAKPTGQVGTTGSSQEGRRGVQSGVRTDKVTGRSYIIGPDGEPDWVD